MIQILDLIVLLCRAFVDVLAGLTIGECLFGAAFMAVCAVILGGRR